MQKLLLDCNIFDLLDQDSEARQRLLSMCSSGVATIVVPQALLDELRARPSGVPDWFPILIEPDSVFILDYSKLGGARLGAGTVFSQHRGTSNQIPDAVLADTAEQVASIFVSEDRRARTRLVQFGRSCRSLTFAEFRSQILGL